MQLVEHRLRRTLWIEPERQEQAVLFLDGELYRDRVGAATIVEAMRSQGELVDVRCGFLSAGTAADRHADFACNPAFAQFVICDVVPLLEAPVWLVGLSLSGLAAIQAGVVWPEVFPRVIAQSPSAWWNGEWLAGQVAGRELGGSRFWVSVGDQETARDVVHPPSGMVQAVSQVQSCGRLVDALRAAGAMVEHRIVHGGHDPACWAEELPETLRLLANSQSDRSD